SAPCGRPFGTRCPFRSWWRDASCCRRRAAAATCSSIRRRWRRPLTRRWRSSAPGSSRGRDCPLAVRCWPWPESRAAPARPNLERRTRGFFRGRAGYPQSATDNPPCLQNRGGDSDSRNFEVGRSRFDVRCSAFDLRSVHTSPSVAHLIHFVVGFALLLHVLFWGVGGALLVMPQPWRRFWPVLIVPMGLTLQSAVVWIGVYAGGHGTNGYAWAAEVVPIALLLLGVQRVGLRLVRTDLGRFGLVW